MNKLYADKLAHTRGREKREETNGTKNTFMVTSWQEMSIKGCFSLLPGGEHYVPFTGSKDELHIEHYHLKSVHNGLGSTVYSISNLRPGA